MDILENLDAFIKDHYSEARVEKRRGRKIIGVTPMHFPEKMVHAVGALPFTLQDSSESVTISYEHIYPFYCGLSQSTVWRIRKISDGGDPWPMLAV